MLSCRGGVEDAELFRGIATSCFVRFFLLPKLLAIDDAKRCQKQNFKVEKRRPFSHIAKILTDALFDRGVATKPANLCKTRHTGLGIVLEHIEWDRLFEFFNESGDFGSRSDE
jgi:hypothetical protein